MFFLTFVFAMFFIFFPIVNVSAQTAKNNEHWVCLKGVRCDLPGSNCQGSGAGYVSVHRVRLVSDPKTPPYPGQTYVLECLGQVCTTGNAAADTAIFGTEPIKILEQSSNYKFEGFFKADGKTNENNPFNNPSSTIGPFEWQSLSTYTARKYMALNFVTPDQAAAGNNNTLQQGTINFETANKDCEIIRWDPYGRVFNSMTLEPIMNVKVFLEKKDATGGWVQYVDSFGKVQNPYRNPQRTDINGTEEDGAFSFVVEDGTYRLRVVSPTTNLIFPYDSQKIHPNYSKIYSDIYPGKAITGEEVYEIIQTGKIQHRDIPLATRSATFVSTPPKRMEFFYNKINGKAIIKARSSHPFTKVSVYTVIGDPPVRLNKLIFGKQVNGDSQANKDGWFAVEIDESGFAKGEMFGQIDLERVDLTSTILSKNSLWYSRLWAFFKSLLMIESVNAQTDTSSKTTMNFQPIPSYIEGYAYDAKGNVLTNTAVGVYLTFSNRPYSETKTDTKGYYRFSSENLPTMPYELRYTSATGNITKTTTGKFITQNKQYFTTNKVDPYIYKDKAGNLIKIVNRPNNLIIDGGTKLTGQPSSGGGVTTGVQSSQGTGGGDGSQTTTPTFPTSQGNSLILVTVILLTLILVVGGILVFYMIKKNQTPPKNIV